MTNGALLKRLVTLVRTRGSQKAAAEALGVSAAYLSDVLRGKREPGPKVLRYFGVRRVTHYDEEAGEL
jgi:transcriptional regulator with XRE-family HTH domain